MESAKRQVLLFKEVLFFKGGTLFEGECQAAGTGECDADLPVRVAYSGESAKRQVLSLLALLVQKHKK